MNNNPIFQLIQQSLRVTIGATTSLLETIQDPQKRSVTLSELQTQLQQKTLEWSEKGEITEQEARRFVEQLLNKSGKSTSSSWNSSSSTASKTTPTTSVTVESDLKELTDQIIALRNELEQLRQSQ
jgi:polyhydroxyalkanoate synthesis regulator phasin